MLYSIAGLALVATVLPGALAQAPLGVQSQNGIAAHARAPVHHISTPSVHGRVRVQYGHQHSNDLAPSTELRASQKPDGLLETVAPALPGANVGTMLMAAGYALALLLTRRRVPTTKGEQWALMSVAGDDGDEEGGVVQAQAAFSRVGQEMEVASQYKKLRLIFYGVIALVTSLSALVYGARLVGQVLDPQFNDYLDTTADLGVNLFGLLLVAVFYQNDKIPEEKTFARSEEGGALATLRIRQGQVTSMVGEMRTQSGVGGKRVALMACNPQTMEEYLEYYGQYSQNLLDAEVLLVPLALPMTRANTIDPDLIYSPKGKTLLKGDHLAIPAGGDWVSIFGAECDKAQAAGVLPVENGFSLLLGKDGRVLRRVPGLPTMEQLVDEDWE